VAGGACCLPDGSCVLARDAAQCGDLGGSYLGDGSQCTGQCADGRIWTDCNADGLPDGGSGTARPGDVVTADVWIDASDFQWTNFQAFVEWPPGAMTLEEARYRIDGGTNLPIDDFSHPSAVGLAGIGYDERGIDRIGTVSLRVDAPVACCLDPIIDPDNEYSVTSMLGRGAAFFLFSWNPGSCWEPESLRPVGACSFLDGRGCVQVTRSECAARNGRYHGDSTTCTSLVRNVRPTGACCLADGCAADLTRRECTKRGGSYLGDGSQCDAPLACSGASKATASAGVRGASWGTVKALYR
jgi:hypothetical protein